MLELSSRAISPGCGVMIMSTPSRPISRSRSPANAFSASASSTSGTPARSTMRLHERRRGRILTEAWPDRDHVRLQVEHAIHRGVVDRARGRLLQRLGHVLGAPWLQQSRRTSAASRWSPAPPRSAARRSPPGARRRSFRTTPPRPGHGRNRPCANRPRGPAPARASAHASASRCTAPRSRPGSAAGMPMSAITRSPQCASAGGSTSGIFGAARVTVIDASIASPSTSWVSADRPVGRSIATIGTPEAVHVRARRSRAGRSTARGTPCRGSRPRSGRTPRSR